MLRQFLLFNIFFAASGIAVATAADGYPGHHEAATDRLRRLVEEYWDAYLALDPIVATRIGDRRYNDRLPDFLSKMGRAAALEVEEHFLTQVATLPSASLNPAERLTQQIFLLDRRNRIATLKLPEQFIPLSQFDSLPLDFAEMGAGDSAQPFKTIADYDSWLKRCDAFPTWIDHAITNMRQGVKERITLPRAVVVRVIEQLERLANPMSGTQHFLGPLRVLPTSLPVGDRVRLERSLRAAVTERVVPAYARLLSFLRDEYQPQAREELGLWSVPGGSEWYDLYVRRETTTDLSPEQIHAIGIQEVERITQEMTKIVRSLGREESYLSFMKRLNDNSASFYARPEDLIDGYHAIGRIVDRNIGRLFAMRPKARLTIRPIEAYRAPSMSAAYYEPPPVDGQRDAIFYVNTYDLRRRPKYSQESLYLHEAEPGHHLQVALQAENETMPRFRRFGGYGAYGEGWALYAESLGNELGLHKDPTSKFGALVNELLRAARLVVDTGIHLKGWTRDVAIQFHIDHVGLPARTAADEVDRYAAMPAQALAYKIGELEIKALRSEAMTRLGSRFDIRTFHTLVLAEGSLPLSVLRIRVREWILEDF